MSRAGKQATAKSVALAIISQVVLFASAAEARGGGGHGGGGHAVAGSGGGGSSNFGSANGGGSGSGFHPNPNGPYSGNNLGSSSYASPQQNNTFVPRQDVGHARRYGGGGGGYGRYNNNYGNYGNQNQMAPPLSQYQSQVFSGPAYISPVGYHNYVKSYSWPSAADTLPESSAAGQAATAQLMQSR